MALPKDLRKFIESLNSQGVDYVLVGAYALAHHGRPRFTGDPDVFVRMTPENAKRIALALQQFGFGDLGITADDFLKPNQVIQLGIAPNRIDLLTTITGVTFEEAWNGRVVAELDGIPVFILGRNEFIQNKRALGRPRDLADLELLGEISS